MDGSHLVILFIALILGSESSQNCALILSVLRLHNYSLEKTNKQTCSIWADVNIFRLAFLQQKL